MQLRRTARFLDPGSPSERHARRARSVFPDGITRETIRRHPYSPSQARGLGSRLIDVEGEERIDFLFNYTSLIHGHCYPPVIDAISGQARRLGAVSFPSGIEEALGRELLRRVAIAPGRIRFVNSGTEAVMLAVRTACAATGRHRLLRFEGCYHGSQLPMRRDPGSGWIGIDMEVCAFNSPEQVKEAFRRCGRELACVLLDPCPTRGALAVAEPAFLAAIESLRQQYGVLLVVDEVVSSRASYSGLAGQLGIAADLICLGKYIGGGLPVGAIVMRSDLASLFSAESGPAVAHSGTFNGNALTMAAGLACLERLDRAQIERINALTAHLCRELRAVFSRQRVGWAVRNVGSLFHLWPEGRLPRSPEEASDPHRLRQLAELAFFLLCHGAVLAPSGLGCLATIMEEPDLDYLVAALDRYLALEGRAA
jgi:glutamate-1-semialdehyde 2,1-aminomutase